MSAGPAGIELGITVRDGEIETIDLDFEYSESSESTGPPDSFLAVDSTGPTRPAGETKDSAGGGKWSNGSGKTLYVGASRRGFGAEEKKETERKMHAVGSVGALALRKALSFTARGGLTQHPAEELVSHLTWRQTFFRRSLSGSLCLTLQLLATAAATAALLLFSLTLQVSFVCMRGAGGTHRYRTRWEDL